MGFCILRKVVEMALIMGRSKPLTVFELNGVDENSGTFALGWVLEKSPKFLQLVMESIFGAKGSKFGDAVIALQKHGSDGGYTDIEISSGAGFHCVVEAKRWWGVPSATQLGRYAPRLAAGGAKRQRLVSISAADPQFVAAHLPNKVSGISVRHLSWRDVQKSAKAALKLSRKAEERLWLRELVQHLEEFVGMERLTSNSVYVVSLNNGPVGPDSDYTFIDVVAEDQRYFHPIKPGWPSEPPNYLGFRYKGRLQSVHHVEKFEIVPDLSKYSKKWPISNGPHFVYHLGPPMAPPLRVGTGKLFRNGRVHCAIDTLLSGKFPTISEARDETKRRLKL